LQAAARGRDQGKNELETNYFYRDVDLQDTDRLGGLLGITVLTSIGEGECSSIYGDSAEEKVMQFAHNSLEAGLDGIVCSGQELEAIRADSELDDMLTVVPGITPEWVKKADDQKRIVTPGEAVRRGGLIILLLAGR
jgi:orotidine-5'-phosphate decarboxylase